MPEIPDLHIEKVAPTERKTFAIPREQLALLLDRKLTADHAIARYTDVQAAILTGFGIVRGTMVSIDTDQSTIDVEVPIPPEAS